MARVYRARQSKGFALIELLAVVAALLLIAVRVPNRPLPPSGWVGKTVFVRTIGTKLDPSPEPRDLNPMDAGGVAADAISYRVDAERAHHVQVRTRQGVSGWLRKDQVALLDAELANQLQARAGATLYDDAVAYFTKRLEGNPNDMDALNRRAAAWRAKGDLDAAIQDASEGIRRRPSAVLYNNRAIIYHAKKDYDKAIADYAQALKLSPKYALVFANRAVLYHGKKDYDLAIADATEAIQIDPKSPGAYRTRGIAWYGKKEDDKAIADLTQALQLDPKLAQAYLDRAHAFARKKDHAKAHADYHLAHRLDPNHAATLAFWLVSCPDAKYRDGNRALELATQTLQRDRDNPKAMEARAAAHAELGRFDEAIRWQERALQHPSLKTDADAQRRLEQFRMKQAVRQE